MYDLLLQVLPSITDSVMCTAHKRKRGTLMIPQKLEIVRSLESGES
jgi:hypothetical protein